MQVPRSGTCIVRASEAVPRLTKAPKARATSACAIAPGYDMPTNQGL